MILELDSNDSDGNALDALFKADLPELRYLSILRNHLGQKKEVRLADRTVFPFSLAELEKGMMPSCLQRQWPKLDELLADECRTDYYL